jgi:hypothetical protein
MPSKNIAYSASLGLFEYFARLFLRRTMVWFKISIPNKASVSVGSTQPRRFPLYRNIRPLTLEFNCKVKSFSPYSIGPSNFIETCFKIVLRNVVMSTNGSNAPTTVIIVAVNLETSPRPFPQQVLRASAEVI